MKSILRKLIFFLCSKQIKETTINSKTIKINKNELKYFLLSTNMIISFEKDGQLYYFRECPLILPFREYCEAAIKRFFDSLDNLGVSEEHFKQEILIKLDFSEAIVEKFKKYVEKHIKENKFLSSMKLADEKAQQIGFSIWEKSKFDKSFVYRLGMYDIEDELLDIAVLFLWYMRKVASGYKTLRIVRGECYSYFDAVRSISSKIVAEEIGLSDLICDACFCTIDTDDGKNMFGVLSKAAPGNRMIDSPINIDGTLQKELLALNVLDVLIYQPDHGPNNYNVENFNGKNKICAFDNDNPKTFFPFFTIHKPLSGCSPIVNNSGMIARPYFDKKLSEMLLNIDIKQLKKRLKPYLNELQIAALIYRLKKLNQAIEKKEKYHNFLIESDEFNEKTICDEVNGGFGITYLLKALKKT